MTVDDVDNKRHLSDTAGSHYQMQSETRSVLRMPFHDVNPSSSSSCENIECINALHSLPREIANDLLDINSSARHHAILDSYLSDNKTLSVNAVTTRAQARKEASKQEIKTDNACTDLDQTQVYIQQDIPFECSLNESIKVSVVQTEVSKVSANTFICECDGNLQPMTDMTVSIVKMGGDVVKRQCDEYVQQHGTIIGPEVVYTQTEAGSKQKMHFLHAIAEDSTQSDLNSQLQAVTSLYIMSLSLINELALESIALSPLRGVSLRDSLMAFKEAIKAITESDQGTKFETSIKQIFIMAADRAETAEIIAALSDIASDRLDATDGKSDEINNDEDVVLDETMSQMQISLSPADYENDSYYGDIYRYLRDGTLPPNDDKARKTVFRSENMFIGDDDLLYNVTQPRCKKRNKSDQLQVQKVVPEKYIDVLLQYVHVALGHGGLDKTYLTLKRSFTFQNAYSKTMKLVNSCQRCCILRHQKRPEVAPLHPVRATGLFELVSIDLINYTKETKDGFRNVFVAIDNLSGYVILAPMKGATADESLKVFLDNVVSRISQPISVHCDRGSNWFGSFGVSLQKLGIKLYRSSSKSAQSNAHCERVIKSIHQLLRGYGATHENWSNYLHLVESAINFSNHSRLNYSPYEIVFGQPARLGIENLLSSNKSDERQLPHFIESESEFFNQYMQRMNDIRNHVCDRRTEVQAVYKSYFDRRRHVTEPNYAAGDLVYLRRNDVRPNKLDLLYHDGIYLVKKVYDSKKYGQLLRLAELSTNKVVNSLIHTNRVKPAMSHKQSNAADTTYPLVTLTSANDDEAAMVVVDFKHVADHAKSNKVRPTDDDVTQTKSRTSLTTDVAKHSDELQAIAGTQQLQNKPVDSVRRFEQAVKIVRKRGYGPEIEYLVVWNDQTRSWLKEKDVGPGLVSEYCNKRRRTKKQ